MVESSNSTVSIDDPNALGNQLWRRAQRVPLVDHPASPGLVKNNRYHVASNLGTELFSRYLVKSPGAHRLANPLPLHLHIMRKEHSQWNSPWGSPSDPAPGISHQDFAKPSNPTVFLSKSASNPLPTTRPLRLNRVLGGLLAPGPRHANPGVYQLYSRAPRGGIATSVTWPRYGAGNIERTVDGDGPVLRAKRKRTSDPARRIYRSRVGDVGAIPAHFSAQTKPVDFLAETSDSLPVIRLTGSPVSGHASFRPKAILRSTEPKSLVPLATKLVFGKDRQSAPGRFLPDFRLRSSRPIGATRREDRPSNRLFVGAGINRVQLSSRLNAPHSLLIARFISSSLLTPKFGRYPVLSAAKGQSGLRNHSATVSMERAAGFAVSPIGIQELRTKAHAELDQSIGIGRMGGLRPSESPIPRFPASKRRPDHQLVTGVFVLNRTQSNKPYLPLLAKSTLGLDANASVRSSHFSVSGEIVRQAPATGRGWPLTDDSPVNARPFLGSTTSIRRQSIVKRSLGSGQGTEGSFPSPLAAMPMEYGVSSTRLGPGDVGYTLPGTSMAFTSARGSSPVQRFVSMPFATPHASAASNGTISNAVSPIVGEYAHIGTSRIALKQSDKAPAKSLMVSARTGTNGMQDSSVVGATSTSGSRGAGSLTAAKSARVDTSLPIRKQGDKVSAESSMIISRDRTRARQGALLFLKSTLQGQLNIIPSSLEKYLQLSNDNNDLLSHQMKSVRSERSSGLPFSSTTRIVRRRLVSSKAALPSIQPVLQSGLLSQRPLASARIKRAAIPLGESDGLDARGAYGARQLGDESPTAIQTAMTLHGMGASSSQSSLRSLKHLRPRGPVVSRVGGIQKTGSGASIFSTQSSHGVVQRLKLKEPVVSRVGSIQKTGPLSSSTGTALTQSSLGILQRLKLKESVVPHVDSIQKMASIASIGTSPSQSSLGYAQPLQPNGPEIFRVGSIHKTASTTIATRSPTIGYLFAQQPFPLGDRGMAPSGTTFDNGFATSGMGRSPPQPQPRSSTVIDMPLTSTKVGRRVPAHSGQGVSVVPHLGFALQRQGASSSAEGSDQPTLDVQNASTPEQPAEGDTDSKANLEALVDKLWQKIQRKLTVERERRGLASRWG